MHRKFQQRNRNFNNRAKATGGSNGFWKWRIVSDGFNNSLKMIKEWASVNMKIEKSSRWSNLKMCEQSKLDVGSFFFICTFIVYNLSFHKFTRLVSQGNVWSERIFKTILFLSALGLHSCVDFPPVAASRGSSSCRALASPVAERRLRACGFSGCSSQALEHRLNSCSAGAQ